ncbi:MAG TPA: hypothetical protein VEG37_02180 [Burkholderiales bacterium]|nr:hypothetical protein [Burkholderiales bacterium]
MRNFCLAGLCSGFVGGLLGAYALGQIERIAAPVPVAAAAMATTQHDVISAARIQLIDAAGRARAELAMSPDGGPGIFFYDTKGRNRLVLGLYSPAESEYPFVVLNDTQNRAAGIFRLFGGHETPVVVLKNGGRDRSIYGLNANSTEPFLVNYSGDGKTTNVFGNF